MSFVTPVFVTTCTNHLPLGIDPTAAVALFVVAVVNVDTVPAGTQIVLVSSYHQNRAVHEVPPTQKAAI
jgi:hypothetical protein